MFDAKAYRARVEAMSDDAFTEEVERMSFLAARSAGWSDYDEKCSVLSDVNGPLYDAVRMRLSRSLRAR